MTANGDCRIPRRLPGLFALAIGLALAGLAEVGCGGSTAAPAAPDGGAPPAADASPPPPQGQDSGGAYPPPAPDAAPPPPATDAGDASTYDAAPPDPTMNGWVLTWSDEFNLADGSPADSTIWNFETGNNEYSTNKELEYYTSGTSNAVIQGSALVITAKTDGASAYKCKYGVCQYTSARMNTAGHFDQLYGRFEARIKIPRGQGMWPAFWLLGNNIGSVGWPQCGEIDAMENVGNTPATVYGSMHGPGYSGSHDLTASYSIPGGALADDFHVYAVEWEQAAVRFYIDSTNYETRTPADVPAGDTWVYDHPFFIILDVAVGGSWPGNPDGTTQFPQSMVVDYVRVYSKKP